MELEVAGMSDQTTKDVCRRVVDLSSCPAPARRPAPLDPFNLDRTTVRQLARVLAERLQQVETFGGKCASCGDAEARAFLAWFRRLLEELVQVGLIGFGGQLNYGADCTLRAALSNSAGIA